MIKDIKYSGYSAVPSDYECSDGELALSLNLINEEGALKPFLPPLECFTIPQGFNLLLIHNTPLGKNFIFTYKYFTKQLVEIGKDAPFELCIYCIPYEDLYPTGVNHDKDSVSSRLAKLLIAPDVRDITDADNSSSTPPICKISEEIVTFSAIGNAIAISTASDMFYLMWRDGKYVELPQQPPFLSLEFALGRAGTKNSNNEKFLDDAFAAHLIYNDDQTYSPSDYKASNSNTSGTITVKGSIFPDDRWFQPNTEGQLQIANLFYGKYNSFRDEQMTLSRFVEPFFVCYAIRLFDGSYVQVSSPVLMNPPATIPVRLRAKANHSPGDDGVDDTLEFSYNLNDAFKSFNLLGRLASSVTDDTIAQLVAWDTLVEGIEIFVSAPIYRLNTASNTPSFEWGAIAGYFKFPTNSNFLQQIQETHAFYHFRTLSVEDLKKLKRRIPFLSTNSFSCLISDPKDIRPAQLQTRKAIEVSPSVNSIIIPKASFSYNSRLILGNLQTEKGNLQSLSSLSSISYIANSKYSYHGSESAYVELYCKDNEGWYVRRHPAVVMDSTNRISPFWFFPDSNAQFAHIVLPASGMYPSENLDFMDAELLKKSTRATSPQEDVEEAVLTPVDGSEGDRYSLKEDDTINFGFWIALTKHEFLSGAYAMLSEKAYENGSTYTDHNSRGTTTHVLSLQFLPGVLLNKIQTNIIPASKISELRKINLLHANNKIIRRNTSQAVTSEANNPFYFPTVNYTTVGGGEVLAFSVATKALSQGQFGSFPLYAFTSEGIWALEPSSTGSFSSRQPVSRDVCTNPEGITQIDDAVVFPTSRGIMMITGSQSQCISAQVSSETPFDISTLPGLSKLHSKIHPFNDSCIPTLPFNTFLSHASFVYDYVNQHLIVFNPSRSYLYIYSLKSHMWGMAYSNLKYQVNCYPNAVGVTSSNCLLDFTKRQFHSVNALMVSRPLKLDMPDILKTIDTVIQRGNFARGHVALALWGSRDLINWHLIWSSKDHFLRGFRGTPYKYFRLGGLCNLAVGESLFNASVQFSPKLTNQPR